MLRPGRPASGATAQAKPAPNHFLWVSFPVAKRRSFFPSCYSFFFVLFFSSLFDQRLSHHLNLNLESNDFSEIIWINANKLVDDTDRYMVWVLRPFGTAWWAHEAIRSGFFEIARSSQKGMALSSFIKKKSFLLNIFQNSFSFTREIALPNISREVEPMQNGVLVGRLARVLQLVISVCHLPIYA